jgi:hypothetical protein
MAAVASFKPHIVVGLLQFPCEPLVRVGKG